MENRNLIQQPERAAGKEAGRELYISIYSIIGHAPVGRKPLSVRLPMAHMYMYKYISVYAHTDANMCAYTHKYTYEFICTHLCEHIQTHTHAYTAFHSLLLRVKQIWIEII